MSPRITLAIASVLLLLGVAAGAFGAHALAARLPAAMLAVYATAVQYHLVHALGLLVVGVLRLHWPEPRGLQLAALLLIAGIVLFSGSLYLLALTGVRHWGMVTPVGGTAWLAAWAVLAWTALRQRTSS